MRLFLSSLESSPSIALDKAIENNIQIPYILVSFYYIQKSKKLFENFKKCLKTGKYILVDSGAHTFQQGHRVDWEDYTKKYADFIKKYDCPKILGYFEMDADVIIGYPRVKKLRKILTSASDKIIPVWHKGRGIEDFKQMCQNTKGNIVSITGFSGTEIKDNQYGMFIKYAWQYGKKIHCLGMSRSKILDRYPFDFVDSSSWRQHAVFGNLSVFMNKKIKNVHVPRKVKSKDLLYPNLIAYIKLAKYYNYKWSKINNDLDA